MGFARVSSNLILIRVLLIASIFLNSTNIQLYPAVLRIRIHMFLGLQDPDPDPLVRGMDPDPDPALDRDPDPSIIMQKIVRKKNLDSSYFVTLFEFLSLKNDVKVASKSHSRKNCVKKLVFCWHLEGQ
jgi:hypothetical protein